MELARLIDALSDPTAYPHSAEPVTVLHTHISVVFLAGPYAYKVKKPVRLTFLDFSTLAKRHQFCHEEVRLNRRLAPTVYLGVVPIVRTAAGVRVEADGAIVEWAVKMQRLPDSATMLSRLRHGDVDLDGVQNLARNVASFHASAERGDHIASFGRFETVARNARENFDQAEPLVGVTVSRAVMDRLRSRTDEVLTRLEPLIEARARRGVPCDTHGDLRLDHVYLFDCAPPADLAILDCIEFNERFRFADPIADIAFLLMDLRFHGRGDLASVFADEYFHAANDEEGRALVRFYTSYRAAVRAKVEGFELSEKEIPAAERASARMRAQQHWLLALQLLEEPN